jgi:hypothetical protein
MQCTYTVCILFSHNFSFPSTSKIRSRNSPTSSFLNNTHTLTQHQYYKHHKSSIFILYTSMTVQEQQVLITPGTTTKRRLRSPEEILPRYPHPTRVPPAAFTAAFTSGLFLPCQTGPQGQPHSHWATPCMQLASWTRHCHCSCRPVLSVPWIHAQTLDLENRAALELDINHKTRPATDLCRLRGMGRNADKRMVTGNLLRWLVLLACGLDHSCVASRVFRLGLSPPSCNSSAVG